jgi:mRNA interferase YafQ
MRRIERTNAFRSDFKREKRGQHRRELDAVLVVVVSPPADDKPLPERNRDHALGGDWRGHRECHLKPDLLLIYRKPDAEVLQMFVWARTANSSGEGDRLWISRFPPPWFKIDI